MTKTIQRMQGKGKEKLTTRVKEIKANQTDFHDAVTTLKQEQECQK